jgi:hypothetical protein
MLQGILIYRGIFYGLDLFSIDYFFFNWQNSDSDFQNCNLYQLVIVLKNKRMKKVITQFNAKETVELVCRIYICLFLSIYAVGKLLGGQFYTPDAIPDEVYVSQLGSASNFDLAWTFMGRSRGYISFIGISQLIGALLLLFNRTKLIGTAILFPILVNIIVFDIFFLDKYGALASACIYLLMLLIIIFINKEEVYRSLKCLIITRKDRGISTNELINRALVSFFIFAIVFLIDQLLVNFFGYGNG